MKNALKLLYILCAGALLALPVPACVTGPGTDAELTVAQASPYKYGLWSIPGQPILYRPEQVTYYLHLPEGVTPDSPRALVIAVSPTDAGKDMFPSWEKAARRYGFIFACPNRAGNSVRTDVRGQTVMDVLHDVRERYAVDPRRIFLAGFSGGARMATGVALKFPGLFAGLIPMGGIVYNQDPAALAGLKVTRGVHLYAGENDFNRVECERARGILAGASIPAVIMIGPGKAHAQPDQDQCLEIYRWLMEKQAGE